MHTSNDNTRYLLFHEEYEDHTLIGEAESLKDITPEANVVYVVEPSKLTYKLHSYMQDSVPVAGQGRELKYVWCDDRDTVIAPHYTEIQWRYGEPVHEGFCKKFDGVQERIMSNEYASEIDAAVAQSIAQANNGYLVTYPNGATGIVYRATGMIGGW